MSQTRREFITGFCALGSTLCLGSRAVADEQTASISFLVVGDWGKPDMSTNAMEVASRMEKQAEAIDVAFVISTGDNFYERGVASTGDPLWQTAFEDVYSAPALQVPWYVVLGNHDYNGTPDAELAYALRSRRWNMPARYYVEQQVLADGTRADFFFLDTNMLVDVNLGNRWFDAGADAQEQLEWLDTMLAASPAAWKFVVGHHPIYSGGEHGNSQALIDGVLPLLKQHAVQVYINGHDHDLEHIEREGIHFLTSGGGAEWNPVEATQNALFSAASLGFLSATVMASRLEISFINENGDVLYSAAIAIRD
jgi:acid phosphatase